MAVQSTLIAMARTPKRMVSWIRRRHSTPKSYCRWFLLLWGAAALLAMRAWPATAIIVMGPNLASDRFPFGWQVKEHSGKADISGCGENDGFCVHFISRNSSFSLERRVDLNPADLPYLFWRWKVTRLPQAGDFRNRSTDDQAAQLLVGFSDRKVLSYIWDSKAPKGTMENVVRSPSCR